MAPPFPLTRGTFHSYSQTCDQFFRLLIVRRRSNYPPTMHHSYRLTYLSTLLFEKVWASLRNAEEKP